MLINFNEIQELTVPGMNGGTGKMTAKMYMGDNGKCIISLWSKTLLQNKLSRTFHKCKCMLYVVMITFGKIRGKTDTFS